MIFLEDRNLRDFTVAVGNEFHPVTHLTLRTSPSVFTSLDSLEPQRHEFYPVMNP